MFIIKQTKQCNTNQTMPIVKCSIIKFQSNISITKLQHHMKLISLFICILLQPKTIKTNPKP